MCTTCGCSDEEQARITDLEPGLTHQFSEHGYTQVHMHPHDGHDAHPHDFEFTISNRHGHSHVHRGIVDLHTDVLQKNNLLAERNRGWFAALNICALNLLSAPGAGKTTLLEHTIRDLGSLLPISVVEGDQETSFDAERIRALGCSTIQINTGAGCHLDAEMLSHAIRQLKPAMNSLLFIENVGNLVCPALFDLGEQAKVVILSVTEGDDKPLKYPHMFRAASLMILNKIDLLPYVAFDRDRAIDNARRINSTIEVLELSATTGEGLDNWGAWLRGRFDW